MTNDLLFIYGSLSEGMVHFNKIANYITEKIPAEVNGTVYRLEVGFPVLIAEGTASVPGIVARISDSEILLALMDEFHGVSATEPAKSLYFRSQLTARSLIDGSEMGVYSYTLNPEKLPRAACVVTDGNWERSMQENPPVVNALTERHKGYIRKLSESNRRDTIVYPLDVCRDLERLQIIVDKGRRFSLTNLGKEIIRFI